MQNRKTLSVAILANRHHELCQFAVNRTLESVDVDQVLFFHTEPPEQIHHHNIKFIDVNMVLQGMYKKYYPEYYPKKDVDFFSDLMIFVVKELADYVETDYVLIVQPDGFAINREHWDNRYLEYDYIGAPTHTEFTPCKSTLEILFDPTRSKNMYQHLGKQWWVGGGGFSLRSRRLLTALQDPVITNFTPTVDGGHCLSEDINICLYYADFLKHKYDIRFAPVELAINFSSEQLTGYDSCFGFHKIYNAIRFLKDESECIYYLENYFTDQRRFFFEEMQRVINELLLRQFYRAVDYVRNRAIVNVNEGYIDIRNVPE
jgi:hypothetical protein